MTDDLGIVNRSVSAGRSFRATGNSYQRICRGYEGESSKPTHSSPSTSCSQVSEGNIRMDGGARTGCEPGEKGVRLVLKGIIHDQYMAASGWYFMHYYGHGAHKKNNILTSWAIRARTTKPTKILPGRSHRPTQAGIAHFLLSSPAQRSLAAESPLALCHRQSLSTAQTSAVRIAAKVASSPHTHQHSRLRSLAPAHTPPWPPTPLNLPPS